MKVIFLHGWSVTKTDTYGELPQSLAKEAEANGIRDLEIHDIFLSRYISFDDEVTMDDLVRGFNLALLKNIGDDEGNLPEFSCVTHSTGGPVARHWVNKYFFKKGKKDKGPRAVKSPLRNLVMLAPACHGSALAQLGKSRLSRVKSWLGGVETGEKILNSLELGSEENWSINEDFLDYDLAKGNFFPSVLIGQSREKKLYDHLNSYTGEEGGDGVIRVAGASLKYRFAYLKQSEEMHEKTRGVQTEFVRKLELKEGSLKSPLSRVPIGIIPMASHGGDKFGIQKSVDPENAKERVQVRYILEALQVTNYSEYQALDASFDELTASVEADVRHFEEVRRQFERVEKEHKDRRKRDERVREEYKALKKEYNGLKKKYKHINTESTKYSMLVFDVKDDAGNAVNDYDMLILAGEKYDPDKLPSGFYIDSQRNSIERNRLVYFVNHDKMVDPVNGVIKIGFEIKPRPAEGLVRYDRCQFRSLDFPLDQLLFPNQTLYVDVQLTRKVSTSVFEMERAEDEKSNTKLARQRSKPSEILLPPPDENRA